MWKENIEVVRNIIRNVSAQLKRKLTPQEYKYSFGIIQSIDENKYRAYSTVQYMTTISGVIVQKIKFAQEEVEKDLEEKYTQDKEEFREIQKNQILSDDITPILTTSKPSTDSVNEINIMSILGFTDKINLRSIFNPQALFEKNYISFDSRYRNLAVTNNKFSWNFITNSVDSNNSINMVGDARNLIAMKLYQPIIPIPTNINLETARVSILIEEFQAQSFVATSTRRYHFLTRPELPISGSVNTLIELRVDDYHDGEYNFVKPITEFNSLTVVFGDPITKLEFNPDRANATFTYGVTTTVTTDINHNLADGERVMFTNFSTDNLGDDKDAIDQMNLIDGLRVTVTSATTFTVAVDTSGVTPTAGLNIEVYFEAQRMIFAMELTFYKGIS